jgi:hypothetical protein
MNVLKALALFPALTLQLGAQQASYRFSPNDTVRYHEVTEGRIELRPPGGAVILNTRHDAKIALATERGDTVTAWYEELTLSTTSPQGEWHPLTSAALHLPFRLVFTRAGQVTTVSAPSFPSEIVAHTDLDRQFEDFFISLPKSALRPDVTWTDTAENTRSGSPQDTFHIRHIRHYRALRDTVLADNLNAIVIAIEQEITLRSSNPMKNAPVTIFTRLEGREQGTAVFTPTAARLSTRVRRGHLNGEQVLRGEGREMTVPMSFEYSSSLVRR